MVEARRLAAKCGTRRLSLAPQHQVTLLGVVLAVALVSPVADAQTSGPAVGFKLGPNSASASGGLEFNSVGQQPQDLNWSSDWGLTGGFFVDIPLGGSISLQPEVLYTRRSTKIEFGGPLGGNANLTMDYVEVPVLLKFSLGSRFNVFAGGTVGFRTRAEYQQTILGATFVEDIKDETNGTEFGIPVGAGVEFGSRFSFDVRYTFGLTDADDSKDSIIGKWRTFSFLFGFRF